MDFFTVKEKRMKVCLKKNIRIGKKIERIVKKIATRHNL